MAHKWFVQVEDVVHGPFSTDDVRNRVEAGQFSHENLIFGGGAEKWVKIRNWNGEAEIAHVENTASGPVITTETWHYATGGQSFGPLSRRKMIDELKVLENLGDVMIWSKGMKEWAPLFEFHDILTEVGINKRQFPRADLEGKAVLKGSGNVLIGALLSISEGGIGVAIENCSLVPGEALSMEVQSPAFREPMSCKVEVRYVGENVLGLKFITITVEMKGAIIQYIKQSQMRFPIKAA